MQVFLKYFLAINFILCFACGSFAQVDSSGLEDPHNISSGVFRTANDSISRDSLNNIFLIAADSGNTDEVVKLLLKGADVNYKTPDGVTALMYASQNGHTDIVKILIFNGADVNARPVDGATALIAATKFDHEDVMEYLINHGALIDNVTNDSANALIYAVAYGYFIPADMLIYYKANVNTSCIDGSTPLIIASLHGNKELAELLINKGATIDAADKNGWTAMHAAVFNNYPEIVKLLIEKGATVNQKNNEGYTALSIAAEEGYTDIADFLLKHGADASIETNNNLSPYKLAIIQNRPDIIKTLKNNIVKKEYSPFFNCIQISLVEFNLNNRDFQYGGHIGITDIMNNVSFNLGFNTRLWANRTLVPIDNDSYFQFWERRSFVYLNAEKLFKFHANSNLQKGIFIEGKGIYTFGSYRASNTKPKSTILFSPGIGYSIFNKSVGMKTSVEYLDIKVKDMPRWRYTLSLFFTIQRKRFNKIHKEIDWL